MFRRLVLNISAFYGPSGPARLVALYRRAEGPGRYLTRYWSTQQFADIPVDRSQSYRPLRWLLGIGMLAQAIAGIVVCFHGFSGDKSAGLLIGLAVILSAPLVWAHLLFILALGWRALHVKAYAKNWLCNVFEAQVKSLREQNDFTVIAVAGSVGKTTTKLAIANLLQAAGQRVRFQEGNYNDRLTVPLVLFGQTQPGLYNILAWQKIWWRNHQMLRQAYPYDVVVVEFGIDGPGQMEDFAYLRPELAVVTAVSEEHMAFFKTLDVVAREELKVFDFSKQVLVNTDDVATEYLQRDSYESYGINSGTYRADLVGEVSAEGQGLQLNLGGSKVSASVRLLGTQGAKAVIAAATVGHLLGLEDDIVAAAASELRPFAGRMQLLEGVRNSTIVDDTYNASPRAVTAALDVLYEMEAPQRVAILGSMNEMGELSPALHEEVGAYCDPAKLDYVVTIGTDAKSYLAPAAKKAGCTVKSFMSPHKAGAFVAKELKPHAAILAKGSQNGVFAEESLKPLLQNPADISKLVRQSPYWLKIKQKQFGS
jgi:UDP-N-acetylmuramoyl-tripeptide--D-alanyl-D-alanine ligase